jgi:hypothetical protein
VPLLASKQWHTVLEHILSGDKCGLSAYPKVILSEAKDLAGSNPLPVLIIILHQILHFAQNDTPVLGS